jgi:FAD:protein FMN transferase
VTSTSAATLRTWVEHIMGTAIVIQVHEPQDTRPGHVADVNAAVNAAFSHFREIDARFSTYKPDSEVSRLNRGELCERDCSPQLREVLSMCEVARVQSDGYFDIRGHRNDGSIDPSGLVKGWSVEGAARILEAAGVLNYCINAAGDIRVTGDAEPGVPWRIGIRNPWDEQTTVAVINARNLAIATSGTYERGEHIIVPRTGRSPEGIASMTIIGPSLTWADTWATAGFAMGIRGVEWIAREVDGYEACAISTDRQLVMTNGFERFMAER